MTRAEYGRLVPLSTDGLGLHEGRRARQLPTGGKCSPPTAWLTPSCGSTSVMQSSSRKGHARGTAPRGRPTCGRNHPRPDRRRLRGIVARIVPEPWKVVDHRTLGTFTGPRAETRWLELVAHVE
jgi:hypothetical protein